MRDKDCIFCKILDGEIPSVQVYRDDLVTAFMDIQPINRGHVLVIPNTHSQLVEGLDDTVTARMFTVGCRINRAIRNSGIPAEGINFYLADGEAAAQEVFHSHLHCIPRYKGDGFRLVFPEHHKQMAPREVLEETAARIREQLEARA